MAKKEIIRLIFALMSVLGGIGFLINIEGSKNRLSLLVGIIGFFCFAFVDYFVRDKK